MSEFMQLKIEAPAEYEEELTMLLFLHGAEGVSVDDPVLIAEHLELGDWDASVFDGQEIEVGRVTLTTLMENNEDTAAAIAALSGKLAAYPATQFSYQEQAALDWQEEWKSSFAIKDIGRNLRITPCWLDAADDGRIEVRIDPGQAFGTGDHDTTALVLAMLEDYLVPGSLVFDAGCGTAILAIAALKLGAAQALAVDIDPVCREAVAEHLQLNGIAENQLQLIIGDLISDADLRAECAAFAPQLITANLTAGLLQLLAEPLAEVLMPGGVLLCSGIIRDKREATLAALTAAGWEVVEERGSTEWVALALRRKE